MNVLFTNIEKCSNHEFPLSPEKLPWWEKLHALLGSSRSEAVLGTSEQSFSIGTGASVLAIHIRAHPAFGVMLTSGPLKRKRTIAWKNTMSNFPHV